MAYADTFAGMISRAQNLNLENQQMAQRQMLAMSDLVMKNRAQDLAEKAQLADNQYKMTMMDNATKDLNNRLSMSQIALDQNNKAGGWMQKLQTEMSVNGGDPVMAASKFPAPEDLGEEMRTKVLNTLGYQHKVGSMAQVATAVDLKNKQIALEDNQMLTNILPSIPADQLVAAQQEGPEAVAKLARNTYALRSLSTLQNQVDAIREADKVNGTNLGDKYPQDVSEMLEPRWNNIAPEYAAMLKQDQAVMGRQAVGAAPRGPVLKEYQNLSNQIDALEEQKSTLDSKKDADKIQMMDSEIAGLEKQRAALPIGRTGAGGTGGAMTEKAMADSIQKNAAQLAKDAVNFEKAETNATTPAALYAAKMGRYITYTKQQALANNPMTRRLGIEIGGEPIEPPVNPAVQDSIDQIQAVRNKMKSNINDTVGLYDSEADGSQGETLLLGMGEEALAQQYKKANTVKARDTILQTLSDNLATRAKNASSVEANSRAASELGLNQTPSKTKETATASVKTLTQPKDLFSDKTITLGGRVYRLPVTPANWNMKVQDNGDILWQNKTNTKQVIRMSPVG